MAEEVIETKEDVKVVRVSFNICTDVTYFVDKPYDNKLDPQANCDKVLLELSDVIKQKLPLACMRVLEDEKLKPVILNTQNIIELQFETVNIYAVNKDDS